MIATKFGRISGGGYGGYALSGRPHYGHQACGQPPPEPCTIVKEWLIAPGEPDTSPEDGAWLRDPSDVSPEERWAAGNEFCVC